jgi:N-acetylglucosaminyldiphosphoundecaprenol N-acetyl-beta-D-mannosaminyltransferase
MPRVRVLNGSFDAITIAEAVDAIATMIRTGTRGHVATVNVAILMMMRSDPRLQAYVDRAALVVADGQPIVVASRGTSRPLPERVAGIDLLEALLARAARDGFRVYLLGARPTILRAAARRMQDRWPGLELCGMADGYFPPDEAPARACAVARSAPDLLVVAMGVPRQEYFVETHWDDLRATVVIGVGGSLDVLGGVRPRAPRILQRLSLEWLFRLAKEPRRLWKRYLSTNSQFLWLTLRELIRSAR